MPDNDNGWATVISELGAIKGELKGLKDKIDTAHNRIDKVERQVADDLRDIKHDVKDLLAYANQSKGGIKALWFALPMGGGIIGAITTWLANFFMNGGKGH